MKKASVCMIMCNGKLLVLKRADGCSYPNKWCLPGGRSENSETAVETMFREVEEETGIVIGSTVYLHAIKNERLHLTIFFSKVESEEVTIQECEISDYRWVDLMDYKGDVDLPPMTEKLLSQMSEHYKANGDIKIVELRKEIEEEGL